MKVSKLFVFFINFSLFVQLRWAHDEPFITFDVEPESKVLLDRLDTPGKFEFNKKMFAKGLNFYQKKQTPFINSEQIHHPN